MRGLLVAWRDGLERRAVATVLVGLVACAPSFELEGGEQITCAGAEDCPAGMRCSALSLCVANGNDTAPPVVSNVQFQRDQDGTGLWLPSDPAGTSLGRSAQLQVSFEVDEQLLSSPKVTLGRGGEALVLQGVFEPTMLRFGYALADGGSGSKGGGEGGERLERGEGAHEVWASLIDRAGNPTEVRLGEAEFDFTAPRVVPETVSITLVPGPGNPLREVEEVGNGTRIMLAFTLSEKLADDGTPEVWTDLGDDGGGRLDFAVASHQGNTWVFRVDFASTAALQMCPQVLVRAVDAAGNGREDDGKGAFPGDFPVVVVRTPQESPLPPHLCFDTVAPRAPGDGASAPPEGCGIVAPGLLTYQRIPWGRSGGRAAFRVLGADCSMEADETVIAYDGASRASASELARGRSTSRGALDLDLSLGDRERVWVAAADRAGNLSGLALVEDVEWVATLGGKVAGSRLQNPSVFSATALLAPTLAQDPSLSGEVGGLALASLSEPGGEPFTRAGEQAWRPRSHPGDGPAARASPAAAFDTWRGRWVLFGGAAEDGRSLQDVWEYEPARGAWSDRTPAGTRPPARKGHAMVFDSRRGKAIVFGGAGGSLDPTSADRSVWEWDGATGLWTQRPVPESDPGLRLGHAMAYDPVSGRVLLFGGRLYSLGSSEDRNDLWTWDPGANVWEPVPDGAGQRPGPRASHAMAYDPVTRQVYLHGGLVGGLAQADLWRLDPATKVWVQLSDSDHGRAGHALLPVPDWEAMGVRLLVVAGSATADSSSAESFLFDGAWHDVPPAGAAPEAREGFAAGWDPVSRRVLVFGGTRVAPGAPDPVRTVLGDTLDAGIDGAGEADWVRRSPRAADPPARSGHLLAPAGPGRALLFGGKDGALRADAWFWSERATAWAPAPASTPWPQARARPASACDESTGTVYAFGGEGAVGALDDLWSWDEAAGWTTVAKVGDWPQAREGAAMVYVPERRELVLFGGKAGTAWPDELWTKIDGQAWTRHPKAGPWPDAREGASLAALPGGKVVLFGGRRAEGGVDLFDPDLWEWDGALGKWVRRGPGPTVDSSVQTRSGATLLYSLERSRLLLFGGERGAAMQDPWELEPVAALWTPRASFATPPPRARHAVARLGARALLFGGANGTKALGDTWEWDPAAAGRPAAIWTVPLPDASELRTLAVRSFAGGQGRGAAGAEVTGAELLRWDVRADAWQVVAHNGAASAPAALLEGALGADELARSLLGDAREVSLAFRPLGANGGAAALAEVGVDYVELTVRYRAKAGP